MHTATHRCGTASAAVYLVTFGTGRPVYQRHSTTVITSPTGMGAQYCDGRVCPLAYLEERNVQSNVHEIFSCPTCVGVAWFSFDDSYVLPLLCMTSCLLIMEAWLVSDVATGQIRGRSRDRLVVPRLHNTTGLTTGCIV